MEKNGGTKTSPLSPVSPIVKCLLLFVNSLNGPVADRTGNGIIGSWYNQSGRLTNFFHIFLQKQSYHESSWDVRAAGRSQTPVC